MAKENTTEPNTYQINFKYINKVGQIRNGAVAVMATNRDEAILKGKEQAQKLYGTTARVTSTALW